MTDAVQAYALRRDADKTFEWLDHAWDMPPDLVIVLHDPFLLRSTDDPRFAAFARSIGLPTTTDAQGLP